MYKEIKGFNGYLYDDENNVILNPKGKQIAITNRNNNYFCKMKDDNNKWKGVTMNTVKSLSGIIINLDGYTEIPFTDSKYFINELGEIISFNFCKNGVINKIYYPKDGKHYPVTCVKYKGKSLSMGVHQLLSVTFLDKDYIEKGLVCLHLDNNKNNHILSNLKIGTYSENNKQAYDDGLNKGNGFKKS